MSTPGTWGEVNGLFPQDVTAVLTGTTPGQLRYWRASGLFVPENSIRSRVFYSFRDLVALRTCARLRASVSVQKIRHALDTLRGDMQMREHLSRYTLVVSGETVALVDGDSMVDLVTHERQEMIPFEEVFVPFVNKDGDQVVDFFHPRPNLEVMPGRQDGWPTIAGTRIRYDVVASLMVDVPASDIHVYFPPVTEAAARDAYDFDLQVRGELACA